jgi:hypothetical protein
MFTASFFSRHAAAPHPRRPQPKGWFRVQHSWILGAAALQSACSLLIEVDDGLNGDVEVGHAQGGSTSDPDGPDASGATAGSSGSGEAGAAGSTDGGGSAGSGGSDPDAGAAEPDGGDGGSEQPIFDLAFIEDSEEADATLRLVNSAAALSSEPSDEEPPWRIALHPERQVGGVLDFAWSPDGERIAVRYAALNGPRLAFFAAPEWREIAVEAAPSPGDPVEPVEPVDLDATPNYRWSPSSDALALELSGGPRPLVGAYVMAAGAALEIAPVAFDAGVETMDWLSATSLYVIHPVNDEPALSELRLSQRALEEGEPQSGLGLFFPVDLRHVPGGVLAVSDDPTNYLFFWPESPEQGFESVYLPSAYLSGDESLVAEFDDESQSPIYPLSDSSSLLDTLPGCATVLGWAAGPERRSLAGSKIACLPLEGQPAVISIHAYDTSGARTTTTLDDDTLRADLATTEDWEGHARGASRAGEFMALASSAHDVLIDLRGAVPRVRVTDAAAQGSTARGFSPSGQYLLRQRGRSVDFVVLGGADDAPPFELPDAFVDMPPCELAHHSTNWCGASSAARRASARWSFGSDIAAHLASGEGLVLLGAGADGVSMRRTSVSTCGASCVRQYEFGR